MIVPCRCFASNVVKWHGVYSVATRPKLKKGGRVSSNTEEIPEMVDTGVGGSSNAQTLSAASPQVDKCE